MKRLAKNGLLLSTGFAAGCVLGMPILKRGYRAYQRFSKKRGPHPRIIDFPHDISDGANITVVFDTHHDAERLVKDLQGVINDYGFASVADLYELCGLSSPELVYGIEGWDKEGLKKAGIRRGRHGYFVRFPKPVFKFSGMEDTENG